MLRLLFGLSLLTVSFALPAASMQVIGTAIVVTDADGQTHRGSELDGAQLDLGELGTLRIEHSSLDTQARFPDELWLLQAQLRSVGASEFANFCTPDPKGDTRMLIYAGFFDEQLQYVADPQRFSISCVSGVEAKCLRWGYLPWRTAPVGGASLAPYYQACIRLARADYCGDDHPSTRDGTSIDVYDRVGVQQPTPELTDYAFEAGWNSQGAVCVHHPRIPDNLQIADLPLQCPRLQAPSLGSQCDEAAAARSGALLYNRSIDRSGASANR